MATTANYSWTTPDDTALVKDGASAIRALGTAIDTSMNTALGTKKAGMVLLSTTTFSAVSSQPLTNVFSTTYRNYRFEVNLTAQTSGRLRFQLGNSGTAVGGTDYTTQNLLQRGTTVTGSVLSASSVWQIPGEDVTQGYYSFDVFQPFETLTTRFAGNGFAAGSGGSSNDTYAGAYDLTTSFTDFFLVASTGTITGTVSVYGYNK